MPDHIRLAWFSPLPPVRSGVATNSAELLPHLEREFTIDRYDEPRAHDFVWTHRLAPYDLVVYQLGNASCHDYIWAYLACYPGLVVLHDPRLHHARARQLLRADRAEDYRREFEYDHPDAPSDVAEYAIAGLGGPIYYFWSMVRVVMRTARMVAVFNPRVAEDLRAEFPDTPVAAMHLGTSPLDTSAAARARMRAALGIADSAIVFAVFGTITAEKRIGPILRAFAAVAREGADVRLVLAGDGTGYPTLAGDLAASGVGDRVHVTGYLDDEAVASCLAAADVCLCLRWPTAQETSASWLQCLAAARPTVLTDLAHQVDIPSLDPVDWRPFPASADPVAVRIAVLDEEKSLRTAMSRLARDGSLRDRLSRAGHAYWSAHHTLATAAGEYRRLIRDAVQRPAPAASDLPAHFTDDYSTRAAQIAARFGIAFEDLWAGRAG